MSFKALDTNIMNQPIPKQTAEIYFGQIDVKASPSSAKHCLFLSIFRQKTRITAGFCLP